jgi:hypothetical protein
MIAAFHVLQKEGGTQTKEMIDWPGWASDLLRVQSIARMALLGLWRVLQHE